MTIHTLGHKMHRGWLVPCQKIRFESCRVSVTTKKLCGSLDMSTCVDILAQTLYLNGHKQLPHFRACFAVLMTTSFPLWEWPKMRRAGIVPQTSPNLPLSGWHQSFIFPRKKDICPCHIPRRNFVLVWIRDIIYQSKGTKLAHILAWYTQNQTHREPLGSFCQLWAISDWWGW